MSRRLLGGSLAAAAIATAAVLAVLLAQDVKPGALSARQPAIEVAATLTPTAALFGDTVVGRLQVTVDRRNIDPRQVRFQTAFDPYSMVGGPALLRRDVGELTYLTYRVTLRCLAAGCSPSRPRRIVFPAAGVVYPSRGGGAARSLAVAWPTLELYSRLDRVELSRLDPHAVAPWRGDLLGLPQVTYAVEPSLLRWLLTGGGAALLLAGCLLLWRLLPRRRPAPVTQEAAAPLTPLERALLVVEASIARSVAEQRTALELLADALDAPDSAPLADDARRLAWSESAPAPPAVEDLVARVRSLIEERADDRGA